MSNGWTLKEDELPNAYEEVRVLLTNGSISKDMIIRGKYENLEWKRFSDSNIKAWIEIDK